MGQSFLCFLCRLVFAVLISLLIWPYFFVYSLCVLTPLYRLHNGKICVLMPTLVRCVEVCTDDDDVVCCVQVARQEDLCAWSVCPHGDLSQPFVCHHGRQRTDPSVMRTPLQRTPKGVCKYVALHCRFSRVFNSRKTVRMSVLVNRTWSTDIFDRLNYFRCSDQIGIFFSWAIFNYSEFCENCLKFSILYL